MPTLRITAGTLRGRRIAVPPDQVRPTSERARQAYFDIVGPHVEGARFLDLFAGSGIFSFEAVSRGAREAVAIDSSRAHAAAIAATAAQLGAPVTALTSDALAGMKRTGGAVFQLLYADPPYAYASYPELLRAIDADLPLAEGAVVAIEHRRRTDPFSEQTGDSGTLRRLRPWRRAEYGEVWISFFIT